MNRQSLASFFLLAAVFGSGLLFADEPVSKGYFSGIAIGGYDAVSFHQQSEGTHKATKGVKKYSFRWKGAKWRFATEENRIAFAADPTRYAPAYNGFCANALSLGNGLVKTTGTHWQIYEKQLYLFYSKQGRKRWLQGDYHEYKKAADAAWLSILTARNN